VPSSVFATVTPPPAANASTWPAPGRHSGGAGQTPAEEGAKSFLKFIQSCDNEPAHISGGARDGRATLVALLRYAVDAWTIEDALGEGQRLNGGVALSPEQVTWLLGWAASHVPGSEQIDSCATL